MQTVPIGLLSPNPWNTNHLSPDAERKLDASIRELGLFKPIVVREMPDGTYEILGGQHRWESCVRVGNAHIEIFNLGIVDEKRAKAISVVDNGRYGQDDANELALLLAEIDLPERLAEYMPFHAADLEAMNKLTQVNLDQIGFEDDEEDLTKIAPKEKPAQTHVVMRFKVDIANQGLVERAIKSVIERDKLDDSDALVNAGDALVQLAVIYEDRA